MANNLGDLVTKYTQILDEVVVDEAKTSDLDANQNLLGEFNGAGQIQVAKVLMDGLANYSRTGGFTQGDIDLTWELFKLTYDRGRSFSIDIMDDEERLRVVTMNVMAQFVRTKVVPEIDAVRFAKLYEAGTKATAATFTDAATAADAVLTGEEVIEDAGAALSECVLYCTSAFKGLLRKAQEYRLAPGTDPDTTIERFDEMKLVTVPQNRFYSAVDLYDGTTTGEEDGGYVKDAAGVNLNFLIVHPSACAAITKHQTLRYFAPEVNQNADAHLWQYRVYHDLLVFDNKKSLIYGSAVANA